MWGARVIEPKSKHDRVVGLGVSRLVPVLPLMPKSSRGRGPRNSRSAVALAWSNQARGFCDGISMTLSEASFSFC